MSHVGTADPPQTRLGEAERQAPVVTQSSGQRCRVVGSFHRAVDSAHKSRALEGSRLPGRYSAAGQPTLYLSSSPEGVAAAMAAHGGARGDLTVLPFEVHAEDIVDLHRGAGAVGLGLTVLMHSPAGPG